MVFIDCKGETKGEKQCTVPYSCVKRSTKVPVDRDSKTVTLVGNKCFLKCLSKVMHFFTISKGSLQSLNGH